MMAVSGRRAWPAWANALTVAGLLVGGVVLPLFGWIISAVALWLAPTWKPVEKVLGTLILPGGLLGAVYLIAAPSHVGPCNGSAQALPGGGQVITQAQCTGGGSHLLALIVLTLLLVAPLASASYLAWACRRRVAPGASTREQPQPA